jgi:hypothetical protein
LTGIPGHGAIVDKAAVAAHRDMMIAVRDKVAALVRQNKTQEEVVAAKPTADFDGKVTGATPMTADRFVGQLYQEIKTARFGVSPLDREGLRRTADRKTSFVAATNIAWKTRPPASAVEARVDSAYSGVRAQIIRLPDHPIWTVDVCPSSAVGRFRWNPAASWYAFASASSSISPNGRAKNVTLVGEPFSAKPLGMLIAG